MQQVDVCLIVEESYDASSWSHQLISGLPELSFAVVTLLADRPTSRPLPPVLPENVVDFREVYLFDDGLPARPREPGAALMHEVAEFHDAGTGRCPVFAALQRLWPRRHGAQSLLTARASWRLLRRMYEHRGHTMSFLDYVWTWRALHGPLFRLMDTPLPVAPVYHALSTGYAGFLAALGKLRLGAGMALSEHDVYVLEREVEIADSPHLGRGLPEHERALIKEWWRRGFEFTGELAYACADRIVTRHGTNRALQLGLGAPPERLDVVPHGLALEDYVPLRHQRDWSRRPFCVGLVGRVVATEDLKTFLQALHLASQELEIEALVLGPTDDEPLYFEECRRLVEALGLGPIVRFAGSVDVRQYLPMLDLHVSTSVLASPSLAVLEASAAGVPSVATDVGACREWLEGRTSADVAMGPSGVITRVAAPEQTAQAIVALAREPERHAQLARIGIERVERFYRLENIFAYYRGLYAALTPQLRSA